METDLQKLKMKDFRKTSWALLIIDLQKAYMPFYLQGHVIGAVLSLREAADEAGVPVIYIRDNNETVKEGRPGWDFYQALAPRDNEIVIDKHTSSGFIDTDLEDILSGFSVETLVLTGISTTHCYAATLYDGLSRGYNIIVVADGHSNHYPNAPVLINSFNERLTVMDKVAVLDSEEIIFPRQR
ncbi:MAG: cysteine hydrolase [Spirochaetales bacterium]|nr:cysteine hydrolase [Spirochaetales bacterium]